MVAEVKADQDVAVVAAAAPSLARSIKMVAWSFLGIRSQSGLKDDMARVNPLHVVVVGLLGALVFVVGLIAMVKWVVAK
jgi:Protein of unknown function (DUF2970)